MLKKGKKLGNNRKKQRITFVILVAVCCLGALSFIIGNFRDNIVFFYSPNEIDYAKVANNKIIRVGGMIKEGSVENLPNNILKFTITDYKKELTIHYQGIIPNLFRENQGMVAKGYLDQKTEIFIASELLAKHDEKYMPPEVAKSLEE